MKRVTGDVRAAREGISVTTSRSRSSTSTSTAAPADTVKQTLTFANRNLRFYCGRRHREAGMHAPSPCNNGSGCRPRMPHSGWRDGLRQHRRRKVGGKGRRAVSEGHGSGATSLDTSFRTRSTASLAGLTARSSTLTAGRTAREGGVSGMRVGRVGALSWSPPAPPRSSSCWIVSASRTLGKSSVSSPHVWRTLP